MSPADADPLYVTASLDTNQAVIRLDAEGTPRVSYSPRLVTLIQEVRQLRVLGLTIPPAVEEVDAKARLYFRQAKVGNKPAFLGQSAVTYERQ